MRKVLAGLMFLILQTSHAAASYIPGAVTSGASKERIERARIANNGTASIGSQSGSWLSSVSRAAAGYVTLNFASGIFSSAPVCVCTADINPATNVRGCDLNLAPTTSSVSFHVYHDSTGADQDGDFSVICMGPR